MPQPSSGLTEESKAPACSSTSCLREIAVEVPQREAPAQIGLARIVQERSLLELCVFLIHWHGRCCDCTAIGNERRAVSNLPCKVPGIHFYNFDVFEVQQLDFSRWTAVLTIEAALGRAQSSA